MKNSQYLKQAELLLKVLPIINRESVFALKGGTAINFFVRDLPRLSVDIDLVYLPVEERERSYKNISTGLLKAEETILKIIPGTKSQRKVFGDFVIGLIIQNSEATIKIEPNTTMRGSVLPAVEYELGAYAKTMFELSLKVRSLAKEELYAGKICAALDRQHPRDLYDIKLLFDNEGLTDVMRKLFIVYLISHNRPMHELLRPNFLNIADIYNQEFLGMVREPVALDELEAVRKKLVSEISKSLTYEERKFLISFKSMKPDWSLLGFNDIEKLPAVNWKLMNLKKMDRVKHSVALSKLEKVLSL